jgi:hypothetical protein
MLESLHDDEGEDAESEDGSMGEELYTCFQVTVKPTVLQGGRCVCVYGVWKCMCVYVSVSMRM